MAQSQDITGRRTRWRRFFQLVPPRPSLCPGVGRWSILEIAAHLADAELLASARIRRIITHTAKHLDQMRSAAVAYEASNIKPQA